MQFISYQPLWWLVALVAVALGLRYTLVDRPRWMRLASAGFRIAAIVLLVLALCRPFATSAVEEVHVVFLIDVSESVDLPAARKAIDEVNGAIANLGAGDSWSLFAVGNGVRAFEPMALAQMLDGWSSGVADDQFRSASRLGDALLATRMAFPVGKSRRAVLFTDGQPTAGDTAAALRVLGDEGIDVRMRRIDGLQVPEAAVVSIQPSAPNAFLGEVVRMTVRLATNRAMAAKLRMLHKGVAVQERPVQLDPAAENLFTFDVDMITTGASVWSAELVPSQDHFPINNQATATVSVRGKPRVLVLHESEKAMRSFARLMREQDVELDLRGKHGLPDTMEDMLAFDAIILADIAATDMSPRQMELLKRYVADFGGGLAMFGSENSFGLGGYYKTPVEEVLPLVSRYEKEKEKPSLAMVLVIDKSGSMDGLPMELARHAAKSTVELLSSRDSIAVIGFDSEPFIASEMRSAGDADAIKAAIDQMRADGGTNMYPAIAAGKRMLEDVSAKIKHMIILSDGHTEPGDHEGLTTDMVRSGITVSTVALGDADRGLLEAIAQIGKGRYYETRDPTTVPQIFTKETMQASRSAIKEDIFASVQTGDHPLLTGFHKTDLPSSLGYVMTEAKPTAQVLLAAETGDPLLAVSRFGLGVGMAYTSDLSERWGGEWLAWGDCGKFWAQALRAIVRKADAPGVVVRSEVRDNTWSIDIGRRSDGGEPLTAINFNAQWLDPTGQLHPVAVDETGLGRYRVTLPLSHHEHIALRLHDRTHDKVKVLHYRRPYPAEYRLSDRLPPALASLRTFDAATVRDEVPLLPRREPVTHIAYFAALACLLAGLLLRRL